MSWEIIVSFALGIVATVGGGIGLKLAENRINTVGRIKIYADIDKKTPNAAFIKLDIINAKKVPFIIRDINLVKVKDGQTTCFIQGEYSTTRNSNNEEIKETKYCNDGNYTFVVPQQDTKQVTCLFMKRAEELKFTNKELFIQFYDENGNLHIYEIDEINKIKDNKWIELKEIKQKKNKR